MKRLIFGCGYLGRRVAQKWLAAGDQVFAVTRNADRASEFRRDGILPLVADVTDRATLANFPEVDTILFAVAYDRRSSASRRTVYVDGIANAIECVAGRFGKWISISSTSVYGQDNGEWVDENSPCVPSAENGRIILESEKVLRQHFESSAESTAGVFRILRLAGIYGPDRLLRRIDALKNNEPIEGRGDAWLNLIHVDDAAQVVAAAAERSEPSGTLLVSDDRPVQRAEYYSTLAKLVGVVAPQFQSDASSDETGLNKRCSNRKLRDAWQIQLTYPTFESGLRHALLPRI